MRISIPHLRLPQYSYPDDLYLPPGGSPIVKNNALPCLPQAHRYSRATFEQNLTFEDVTPKVFLTLNSLHYFFNPTNFTTF
jgi:hypothetical protein